MAPRKNKQKTDKGVIYTEDNIPVRTLYLGGINNIDKTIQLRKILSDFGKITSFKIQTSFRKIPHLPDYKFIFVEFETHVAAKNAFTQKEMLSDYVTKVDVAYSWMQPDFAEVLNLRKEEQDLSNPCLFNLNEALLLKIFSYLPDAELFRLASLCKKLLSVYYRHIQKNQILNLVEINLNKYKMLDIRRTFSKIGPHVKTLSVRSSYISSSHTQFIEKYLRNVKHLKLVKEKKWGFFLFDGILSNLTSVDTLKLQNLSRKSTCSSSEDWTIDLLKRKSVLHLDISEYPFTTPKAYGDLLKSLIKNQPNLETLKVLYREFFNLTPIKALSHLKNLIITGQADGKSDQAANTTTNDQPANTTTNDQPANTTTNDHSNKTDLQYFLDLLSQTQCNINQLTIENIKLKKIELKAISNMKMLKTLSISKPIKVNFFPKLTKKLSLNNLSVSFKSTDENTSVENTIIDFMKISPYSINNLQVRNKSLDCEHLIPELDAIIKNQGRKTPFTLMLDHSHSIYKQTQISNKFILLQGEHTKRALPSYEIIWS